MLKKIKKITNGGISRKDCNKRLPIQLQYKDHMKVLTQHKVHMQSSYVTLDRMKIFICNFCTRGFKDEFSFKDHQRLIHSTSALNNKQVTELQLEASNNIYNTQRKITELSTGVKFSPSSSKANASKIPKNKRDVSKHDKAMSVPKDKTGGYNCQICKKSTKSELGLKIHIRRKHGGLKYQKKKKTDIKSYVCHICHQKLSAAEALSQHLLRHTGVKLFGCDKCDKKFYSSGNLKIHIRTHTGEKPYKCKQCERAFSDPSAYRRHTETHEGLKPYLCKECPKAYTNELTLINHERRHLNQRVPCLLCPKTFSFPQSLSYHMRTYHKVVKGGNKHECDHCGSKFVTKGTVERHIKRFHLKYTKHVKCNICNRMLANKHSLKNHVEGVHNKNFRCRCEICGVGFQYESRLKVHVNQVHGSNPNKQTNIKFLCDNCQKSYINKTDLVKHIVEKHLGIQCEICKKMFRSSHKLKDHKLQGCWQCSICDIIFSKERKWNEHFITHHLPKSKRPMYECDYCRVIFHIKQSLRNHMAHNHGPAQTYQCDYCSKTFTNKCRIIDHIRRLHMLKLYCNICMKVFYIESEFLQHKLAVCYPTEAKECEICNKRVLNLRNHLIDVHGPERFECDSCGAKFRYKKILRKHVHKCSAFIGH